MYTLYCKEIHIFSLCNKYILKYYGVTSNFGIRKHLYSVNDKNKTTFIQCCIKDILFKKSISFKEFPIKMIKNNIVTEDDSHLEELKMVLQERKEKRPNEMIFGSFFTFPLWKIRNEVDPLQFFIDFGKNISEKLELFSENDLVEFHSFLKYKKKEEIVSFLEKKNFHKKKEMEDIYLGYGGFCYHCKEGRHIQRLCKN